MEIVLPSPPRDFDFGSGRSSPYASAPSTPKPFGDYYCSAPTSPSHLSQFYRDFDALFEDEGEIRGGAASGVPFQWEEKPGTPKSPAKNSGGDEFDFEFDVFSEEWETASVAADELFDGGVIKPLKPPPRLQIPAGGGRAASPRKLKTTAVSPSPISQTKRLIQGAFSPRHNNRRGTDADAAAAPPRGRERSVNMPKSSSRRAARSLSPLRDTQYPWEEEKLPLHDAKNPSDSSAAAAAPPPSVKTCLKKWRIKDFFLFRSASEGRAADKDPLKKYTAAVRHSSFRVSDGSGSGSGSRRKNRVSAHEKHYTTNRAVSEDLKKKTFLPYKQGILGRLAFNPAVHALANGFGFSHK
ncbi:uncharacterized protein LOC127246555 [Andrographis paniculata]|uniref:uncharacterized protein LOC127246555 n=1 Tax=Andrographis paniculata TaxID=175694 RepID=UPI0021E77274|nr:uncharacterized protein LOC127246555 [Andrographis paniculata]